MTATTLSAHRADETDMVLRKLSELTPQKRSMALTMCSFFIDGMNAQEQISAANRHCAETQGSA